jgi:hypothetical protein
MIRREKIFWLDKKWYLMGWKSHSNEKCPDTMQQGERHLSVPEK